MRMLARSLVVDVAADREPVKLGETVRPTLRYRKDGSVTRVVKLGERKKYARAKNRKLFLAGFATFVVAFGAVIYVNRRRRRANADQRDR